VALTVDGKTEMAQLIVKMDPRVEVSAADLEALHTAQVKMAASLDALAKANLEAHSVMEQISLPMCEPTADVIEDLWQVSHVTPSYIGRAAGGALLLADGVIRNSPIAIVVAGVVGIAAAVFLAEFAPPALARSASGVSEARAMSESTQ